MSISELIDTIREQIAGDPVIQARVASTLSPASQGIIADLIGKLAQLEQGHEADKQAAVEQAKADAANNPEPQQ